MKLRFLRDKAEPSVIWAEIHFDRLQVDNWQKCEVLRLGTIHKTKNALGAGYFWRFESNNPVFTIDSEDTLEEMKTEIEHKVWWSIIKQYRP